MIIMSKEIKILENYCIECEKQTNHTVLFEDIETHRDEYSCDIIHQIVQCRGCDTKSFRKVFVDIEQAYPLNYSDEWDVPTSVETFPKSIKWHKEFANNEIPEIVQRIYDEVLEAIKENALILAGLGLRGTLESICNDLKIKGSNLEKRIDKLTDQGYISKKDAERLHGIRFLGNDAAHDIKKPKLSVIKVAVSIIEHLINSVYILENEANGKLDTAVSDYNFFLKLLNDSLKNFKTGDEIPIAEILGEKSRRIKSARKDLEKELIQRVKSGDYTKLKIGKIDKYKGFPDSFQHFIIQ